MHARTVRVLAIGGVVLAVAHPSSADPPPGKVEGPGALRGGCWKLDGEKSVHLAFENERVRMLAEDHLVHYFARYEEGRVVLWSSGRRDVWKTAVERDVLTLDFGAGTARYRRVPEEPDALQVRPLAFGASAALPPERLAALQKDLRRRKDEDQAVRKDPRRSADMPKVDEENTAFLKKLVGEVGWIDPTRFGREAADAAFLIVQHSGDLPLMAASLPEIEKGVMTGALDAQKFALLHDRLALALGRKQRYGTQLGQGPDEKLVVLPIEDRAHVEKRREALGLRPLSEYLDYFKKDNGGKIPEFLEWE